MAAEDEGRTEEPSEYKLEKARKEGRVAKSQEVSGALVLLFSVLILIFFGKYIFTQLIGILQFYFSRTANPNLKDNSLLEAAYNFFFRCIIPVSLVSAVAAIVGNIIQTKGFIFTTKTIEPKFSKIVPKFGEYFKKTIFSGKGLFNIAKSILKVAIIVAIAYVYIKKDIFVLMQIVGNGDVVGAVGKIAKMSATLLIIVAVLFLAISIPDYFIQKKDFMEEMKMTKQEQKEEYKEMEGDPEVKSKLQQMQRELLAHNIPKAVAESDVVITNPTHFAVALQYDQEFSDTAPKVTAKGEDQLAQTIKRLARENDVPIVENRPIARALYTELEIGDIIPDKYINAIALIYSHLDKFKQN